MFKSVLLLSTALLIAGPAFAKPECFDNSEVTGYYTPLWSDYNMQKTTVVTIAGVDYTYNAAFIAEVMSKSGGISANGENLIYWDKAWRIQKEPLDPPTGYFPDEKDFLTFTKITTVEDGKKRRYPTAFVKAADLEGTAKIDEDQYLGRPWDGKWHFYKKPLSAAGQPIKLGDVAVDRKYFKKDSPLTVTITPTPPGFEDIVFRAVDTGPAITGSHVDVFSGVGFDGLNLARQITGDKYKICFGS